MKKALLLATALVLAACSSHNQEQARDRTNKAEVKIKQDAQELRQKVDAAVQPDSRSASEKLSQGVNKMEQAGSQASVKLSHAALLAEVKAKLASDAGMSTLSKVDVKVEGDVVTLSGSVSSLEQKKAVEQAASQVVGVARVQNNLSVTP
jgi:osmotically-inducible protein OsmY